MGAEKNHLAGNEEEVLHGPQIELRGVSKHFGGVHALKGINLTIMPGTVHGLAGENGAGKSTLGKVIAGVQRPGSGTMLYEGKEISYSSPRAAIADGITMIAQELSLVQARSVIENVFLGSEPKRWLTVDRRRLRQHYDELIDMLGFSIPPTVKVSSLRVADQQKVEILRALARDASVIVMDEPTAALTSAEAEHLFAAVRTLRERGTTIVYVSHFLEEMLAMADTITVLKDGELVKTSPAAQETPASVVTAMLGRSMEMIFPPKRRVGDDAPVVCEVEGLSRGRAFHDVSFKVRAGEIVALAGLVGSGRSEVARAVFGADRAESGTIKIEGKPLSPKRPGDAIKAGVAMLPESRKSQGLIMGRSVQENMSLPHLGKVGSGGVISLSRESNQAKSGMLAVDVRSAGPKAPVRSLSGGNQQKVLFAKWLFDQPRLLIVDEPTRGVDVGARGAIYDLVRDLAASGMAVLMVSSEIEEVLGLAHRVLVMRAGRMVAELDGDTGTEEELMRAAFGSAERH